MPRIGVSTVKGVNMDKEGVSPDVLVELHPDQLRAATILQLESAVEVLLERRRRVEENSPAGRGIRRPAIPCALAVSPTPRPASVAAASRRNNSPWVATRSRIAKKCGEFASRRILPRLMLVGP